MNECPRCGSTHFNMFPMTQKNSLGGYDTELYVQCLTCSKTWRDSESNFNYATAKEETE